MPKVQIIRLVDVFVLGPTMIWFGIAAGGLPQIAKDFMILAGIATIIFNGQRYLEIQTDGN